MEYNKQFFEKVFSAKRMERYYRIHSENIEMAIFHNESICWNIKFVENIHNEILTALGWINVDLILWTMKLDSFTKTCNDIKNKLGWI